MKNIKKSLSFKIKKIMNILQMTFKMIKICKMLKIINLKKIIMTTQNKMKILIYNNNKNKKVNLKQ